MVDSSVVVGVRMKDTTKFYLIMFAIIAGLATLGGGGVAVYKYYAERGLRNRNPGNIDKSSSAWKGKVPHSRNTDSRFEQFEDTDGIAGHIWGLRALYKLLQTYRTKYELVTIKGVIEKYAPATENKTKAYVDHVAKLMKKSPTANLAMEDYPALVEAITRHENNGKWPYPAEDLKKAIALA